MLNDNAKPNRMNLWFGLLLITASVFALSVLVHAKHPFFHLPRDFNLEMGASNEKRLQFEALNRQVNASNAMVVFSIAGSLLAGCLSLVGRPCCSLALRVLCGLVLGAIWGATTGFLAIIAQPLIVPRGSIPSATTVGASQALAFGLLGGGIGLIFTITSRSMNSILSNAIKGILAGGLAGFLFPIIVGLFVTTQESSNLIPKGFVALILWIAIPFATIFFMVTQIRTPQPSKTPPIETEVAD